MAHFEDTVLANSVPFGRFSATSTEYALDDMAGGDDAVLITIYVYSSLNQDVTAQRVGQRDRQPSALASGKFNINNTVTISQGVPDSLSIRRELHPHSYYGLTITTGATAPTAGDLTVVARVWGEHLPAVGSPEIGPALARLAQGQHELGELISESNRVHQEVRDMIAGLLGRPAGIHEHGPVGRLLQGR